MRKRIGVVTTIKNDGTMSLSGPYVHFANHFGQLVVIDALDEKVHDVDLLILPGGSDVDSARYNNKPSYHAQQPNHFMEWFDKNMIDGYIKAGIPIFGICRGFQTLNVHFGGSLDQHINQKTSVLRNDLVDTLEFTSIVQKYNIRNEKYEVNSLHHQGFNINQLGKDLFVLAINKNYQNVEAIIHKDLPIAAVQWHPEEIWDILSIKIIRSFLN